jgi:hypothetical protein
MQNRSNVDDKEGNHVLLYFPFGKKKYMNLCKLVRNMDKQKHQICGSAA